MKKSEKCEDGSMDYLLNLAIDTVDKLNNDNQYWVIKEGQAYILDKDTVVPFIYDVFYHVLDAKRNGLL